MKIKIERKMTGCAVRLEYRGVIYQGNGRTLKEAMREAFSLVDVQSLHLTK